MLLVLVFVVFKGILKTNEHGTFLSFDFPEIGMFPVITIWKNVSVSL